MYALWENCTFFAPFCTVIRVLLLFVVGIEDRRDGHTAAICIAFVLAAMLFAVLAMHFLEPSTTTFHGLVWAFGLRCRNGSARMRGDVTTLHPSFYVL